MTKKLKTDRHNHTENPPAAEISRHPMDFEIRSTGSNQGHGAAVRIHGAVLAAILVGLPTGSMAQSNDRNVTIVLSEEVDVVEPCMAARQNVGRIVWQNVNETLTEYDYANGGLLPRLATEWEEVDEDTWRFSLREGVSFHDGAPFTVDDVIFTIQRNLDPNLTCEVGGKYFGGIDFSFDKVDDTTLEITTNPATPILPLLMSIMPVESAASTPEGEFTRAPVGTGPYTFGEWSQGQSITLDRFDGYWGDAPTVASAQYVFRSDSAVSAAMVATGEADIVPSIAVQDATNPETDFSFPNSETSRLRIDLRIAPLNDRRVREALNLAIDREAMVGTLFSAEVQAATQLVVPTTLGYNDELKVWPYDPERARALLAEAAADGVAVDTPIQMIGRVNIYPNATEVMEASAAMLREVGFNVDLQMYDVAVWNDYYVKPFTEDLGPNLLQAQHDNSKGDPVFTVFAKYDSDGVNSTTEDPELDTMIAEATAATGDKRVALWKEVFTRINDTIISDIPLFHMVGFTRVAPRLKFQPTIATNSELQLSQIEFME